MKKVLIPAILLLSPLIVGLSLRTFDNYQFQQRHNNNSLLQRTVTQTIKDGEWKDSRRQSFKYNSEGQVIEFTNQSINSGDWQNTIKMTYQYDQKTNLETQRVWSRWNENEWVQNLRFEPKRDENQRLIEEVIYEYKDEQWTTVRKNTTLYSGESTEKHTQTYFNYKDNEWVLSWREEFVFKNGKLTLKKGHQWKEGEWKPASTTSFVYNEQGLRIRQSIKRMIDGVETNSLKTTFSYNDNAQKTQSLLQNWKDGRWVDFVKHTHHYSKNSF